MSAEPFDPLAEAIAELLRWHQDRLSGSLEFVFGHGEPKHMNRKDSVRLGRPSVVPAATDTPQTDATR